MTYIGLTHNEQERIAYLRGDMLLARFAGDAADKDDEIDAFNASLELAREQAYKEGKREGMGADTYDAMQVLEQEINQLKAAHRRVRDSLQGVLTWLRGDEHNTVAKRKAFERRLSAALGCTPRY